MSILNIVKSPSKQKKEEYLRVHKSKGTINGTLAIFKFQDKITNQIIILCPSLDITGYGETEEKAAEMLKFSIIECFQYLIKMTPKQIESELGKFGWVHDKFRNKQYSKAYVDINGELKNFNAVGDKVERLTLEAV